MIGAGVVPPAMVGPGGVAAAASVDAAAESPFAIAAGSSAAGVGALRTPSAPEVPNAALPGSAAVAPAIGSCATTSFTHRILRSVSAVTQAETRVTWRNAYAGTEPATSTAYQPRASLAGNRTTALAETLAVRVGQHLQRCRERDRQREVRDRQRRPGELRPARRSEERSQRSGGGGLRPEPVDLESAVVGSGWLSPLVSSRFLATMPEDRRLRWTGLDDVAPDDPSQRRRARPMSSRSGSRRRGPASGRCPVRPRPARIVTV